MPKFIRLESKVACGGPDHLTPTQRAAMVTYKDANICKLEYLDRIARDKEYMIENFGAVDYDLLGYCYKDIEEPHAVLSCEIRGYAAYHNPNETVHGYYIQNCSDEDFARAVDALGSDTEWHITRYGKENTYMLVRGFE